MEQRVALALYHLLVEGEPVSSSALAIAAGVSAERIDGMLARWPGVYRSDDGRVMGYGGLTIAQTRHRIHIHGNTRYTWCAWDTLFIPPLLGTSARVESTCEASGERIALCVHPDHIEPAGERPVVSFIAPDAASALPDIIGHFCCQVHFFATDRAGKGWVAKHPGGIHATLDQAWHLGRRHNALRYPMLVS